MSTHWTFRFVVSLLLLCSAAGVRAQERDAVSGRSRPVLAQSRESSRADWTVSVGGGAFAAGNLFRVINDLTVTWVPPGPAAESFEAERFTATLDEDAAIVFGVGRRLGDRSWLRFDLAAGEMGVTALANDSQFVTPVPYDVLSLTLLALSWEQRLLATRLQPTVIVGVTWADLGAGSSALSQSGIGARLGAGFAYRINDWGGVRLDVTDTILSIDSAGIPAENAFPASSRFTELGPQHVFTLSAQLEMMF